MGRPHTTPKVLKQIKQRVFRTPNGKKMNCPGAPTKKRKIRCVDPMAFRELFFGGEL